MSYQLTLAAVHADIARAVEGIAEDDVRRARLALQAAHVRLAELLRADIPRDSRVAAKRLMGLASCLVPLVEGDDEERVPTPPSRDAA